MWRGWSTVKRWKGTEDVKPNGFGSFIRRVLLEFKEGSSVWLAEEGLQGRQCHRIRFGEKVRKLKVMLVFDGGFGLF